MAGIGKLFAASLPYLMMTAFYLSAAFLILLHQIVILGGADITVVAVYEQLVAAVFLCGLAFLLERHARPSFSFHFLSWSFGIGALQIPLGQVLLTVVSLRYITAAFETAAINVVPALVLAVTILTGQEVFKFWSLITLAKLLSVIASTVGAILLVYFTNPEVFDLGSLSTGGRWLGCGLVGIAVLSLAASPVLLERVAIKYAADMTLAAAMTVFGTLQALIMAVSIERNVSSWKISWSNYMPLFTILYGGLVTVGLGFFAMVWCIRRKGPLFTAAFSPLLVVFSFLLQALVLGADASLWSIAAALLVICSLCLLLWAKSKDGANNGPKYPLESCGAEGEPLLVNPI